MEDKYNKNQGYQEKIKQRYNKIKFVQKKIEVSYDKNQDYQEQLIKQRYDKNRGC